MDNFLERLDTKIKLAKKEQESMGKFYNDLKKVLIEIIQEDFLNSVPDEIVEGKEITFESSMIRIASDSTREEHRLHINGKIIENYRCDELPVVEFRKSIYKDVAKDLSNLIGKEVFCTRGMDWLKFICYY